MGAICIPKAMEQMGGIFGCKVSFDYNCKTESAEFTFAKKTIIDFFVDLFTGGENSFEQNSYVMHALYEIQTQVGDADNGELGTLVKKYEEDLNLIDLKEIRRVIRNVMEMKFPPIIYLDQFRQAYMQNIRRSICMGNSIKIPRDDIYDEVTDENLKALCEAINETSKNEAAVIHIDEPNPAVFKRLITILESTRPSFKMQ